MAGSIHRVLRWLALLRVPQALLAAGPPCFRILMYHGVTGLSPAAAPFGGRGKHLTRRAFERQLDWLLKAGRIVALPDMLSALARGGPFPGRGFVITLDDGYRNNLTQALPALARRSAPATVYVTTDLVEGRCLWVDRLDGALESGRPGHVRCRLPEGESLVMWGKELDTRRQAARLLRRAGKSLAGRERDELIQAVVEAAGLDPESIPREDRPEDVQGLLPENLRDLAASGLSIGAHTVSHPILTRCSESLLRRELVDGREKLESWLGEQVIDFAYPNGGPGDFDHRTTSAVRAAGYRSAMTTVRGPVRPGADPWAFRRVPVNAAEPFEGFLADVSGLRERLLSVRGRFRLRA